MAEQQTAEQRKTALPQPSAEQHAAQMADYLAEGRARALDLGNRGPLRLTADGGLHPEILAAYREQGFYVFEGLIEAPELSDLRAGIDHMLERAPVRFILLRRPVIRASECFSRALSTQNRPDEFRIPGFARVF